MLAAALALYDGMRARSIAVKRLDEFRLHMPREGKMLVDATIFASEKIRLEAGAVDQLRDAAAMPSVARALATPDIHVGYGVPIGCVMATRDVIVPAAVGYDINCGMRLITTPAEARDTDTAAIAEEIRRLIPLGEGKNNVRLRPDEFARVIERGLPALREIERDLGPFTEFRRPDEEVADAERTEDGGAMEGDAKAVSERAIQRGQTQLGTLGGGNHFLELQEVTSVEDEAAAARFGLHAGQLVAMIHSGSRGFGHQVGGDYMKLATRMHGKESPTGHLAFLGLDEPEGRNYVRAMRAAANFAYANRQIMATLVRGAIRKVLGEVELAMIYDVPHNMAKLEQHEVGQVWVHRKGATRAFPRERMGGTVHADVGQPVLIPGSMGTASYLLLAGARARESLFSVNHGAGRAMSRSAATGRSRRGKKRASPGVTDEDFRRAMEGILLIAGDRRRIKEEAPQAYKDIDEVIRVVAGAGLGRVVARMRPLAVLKG